MQAAGEGQHERQDVGADVVVVDLAEIGDGQRMRDQFGIIVAGRRRGLRRLQPAQPLRLRQQFSRQRAEGGIGGDDRRGRGLRILGNDEFMPGTVSASRLAHCRVRAVCGGSIRKVKALVSLIWRSPGE